MWEAGVMRIISIFIVFDFVAFTIYDSIKGYFHFL